MGGTASRRARHWKRVVTETTTRCFEIPVRNLPRFERRAGQLSRRAVKLGCAPITWERVATAERRIKERDRAPYIVEIAVVEVIGPAPRIPGWTFAGTLQHCVADDGTAVNILRTIVEGVPERYRDAGPICDHCKTVRRRNDTYLVRSDAGEWKQIGKNCVADFCGHPSAQSIAAACEWIADIEGEFGREESEGGGGFGGGPSIFELDRFLAHCLDAMAEWGWVSRKAADVSVGRLSTSDAALNAICPPKARRYEPPSAAALEKAQAAIEWAREWEEPSDFAHNCRTIARLGHVEWRTAGLAAAICIAHERAMGRIAERAAMGESLHFGEVGRRAVFTLTVIRRHTYETDYGAKTIVVYRDDAGNVAVWFASGVPEIEIGHRYTVKATVKEHGLDERDGRAVKQTVLSRVAVQEDHGNPRAIPLPSAGA